MTISAITSLALDKFRKLAKTERRAEELDSELKDLLIFVPEEDLSEYIRRTERIRKEEDEKLETFLRRREKRAKKHLREVF